VSATDADTDVAQAKIDNLTMATGTAMSSVVRIAQAQRHLEQLAPEASARLAYLADDHMLGMGETLADLRRDLRRRWVAVLELLVALAVLTAVGLLVVSSAALTAWRRERRRSRVLAERLLVEGHIERLTTETLQAMRQAAREHLRSSR
jgi:hypothetical protein